MELIAEWGHAKNQSPFTESELSQISDGLNDQDCLLEINGEMDHDIFWLDDHYLPPHIDPKAPPIYHLRVWRYNERELKNLINQ